MLDDPRITPAALAAGVAGARWPARMQRLEAGPLAAMAAAHGADLWLDGGHNPHAAAAVADFARALHARDGRPVTLIVGLLATKDAAGVFAALRGAANAVIATGFASDKAADAEALASAAAREGVEAATASGVEAAVAAALAAPGAPPHVMIAGSLYMAGECWGSARRPGRASAADRLPTSKLRHPRPCAEGPAVRELCVRRSDLPWVLGTGRG